MWAWLTSLNEPLWRSAWAMIPAALLAAGACRWLRLRPATRHCLWLGVMVIALAGSLAPPVQVAPIETSGVKALSAAIETAPAPVGCDSCNSCLAGATDAVAADHGPVCSARPQRAAAESPDDAGKIIEKAPNIPLVWWNVEHEHNVLRGGRAEESAAAGTDQTPPTPPGTVDPTEPTPSPLLPATGGSVGRPSNFLSLVVVPGVHQFLSRQVASLVLSQPPEPSCRYDLGDSLVCANAALTLDGAACEKPATIEGDIVLQCSSDGTAVDADPMEQASAIMNPNGLWDARMPQLLVAVTEPIEPPAPTHVSRPALKEATEVTEGRRIGVGDWLIPVTEQARLWAHGLVGVRDAFGGLPPLPAWLWWLGASLVAGVNVARWLRLRRIVARGAPAPFSLRQTVLLAARDMGLRTVPRMVVVNARVSPMVWCGARPVLVVPRGLWSELDDDGRRAVVCHELAHLCRRDHWVCWLETLAAAVYWWHPVVWWVRSRLRDEAENCCDAWVTWLHPGGRRAYAEALLATQNFVSGGPSHGAAAPLQAIGVISGRAGRLARRLTMVMTERMTPKHSMSSYVLAAMLAVTGWVAMPARSCPPKDCDGEAVSAPAAPCVPAAPGAPAAPAAPAGRGPLLYAPGHATTVASGTAVVDVRPSLAVTPMIVSTPASGGLLSTAPVAATAVCQAAAAPPRAGSANERRRDSVEERLARLEEQLGRLNEQLARMGAHGQHAAVADQVRREVEEAVARGAGGEARRKVAEELAAVRRHGGVGGMGAVQPRMPGLPGFQPGGPTIERAYQLPAGKLKALTELMIRSDVPVLVRPEGETSLTVIATEHDHAIFKAFVDMIHPEGRTDDKSSAAEGDRLRLAERYAQYAAAARLMGDEKAAEQIARAAWQWPRIAEMRAQRDAMRARLEVLMRESATIEAMADQLDSQADALRDRAEELRERADELRMKADEKGDSEKSGRLRGTADELMKKAQEMEQRAEELSRKSAELEARASDIESETEAVEGEMEAADEAASAAEEAEVLEFALDDVEDVEPELEPDGEPEYEADEEAEADEEDEEDEDDGE